MVGELANHERTECANVAVGHTVIPSLWQFETIIRVFKSRQNSPNTEKIKIPSINEKNTSVTKDNSVRYTEFSVILCQVLIDHDNKLCNVRFHGKSSYHLKGLMNSYFRICQWYKSTLVHGNPFTEHTLMVTSIWKIFEVSSLLNKMKFLHHCINLYWQFPREMTYVVEEFHLEIQKWSSVRSLIIKEFRRCRIHKIFFPSKDCKKYVQFSANYPWS